MNDPRREIPHLGAEPKPFATCEEIARALPAYHDGSLEPTNPQLFGTIKNHLTHCATCQASDASLRKS